jgi:Uma2 family endonuclease
VLGEQWWGRPKGRTQAGSDCRVHSSDLRVVLAPNEHYVYPDVSMVCGHHEVADSNPEILVNPCVVIEVLSPSTEAYDHGDKWRGDKWAAYRRLASLREYVLVSQAHARIEVLRRERDHWVNDVAEAGEGLILAERFELDVDTIYAGIFELPGG